MPWNASTGALLWVDFYGPAFTACRPTARGRDWRFPQFSNVGSLAFCDDGRLLLAFDRGVFLFDPRDSALVEFSEPNQQRTAIGYNDGKVDRTGHFWIGTFDVAETAPRAILYRLDDDGGWQIGDNGFVVCNGPAFSPRGDVLYFNDTIGRQTLAYVSITAAACRADACSTPSLPTTECRTACASIRRAACGARSMAAAKWSGCRRRESVMMPLPLPVPNVTACCPGGTDLRTLFVTTGHTNDAVADQGGALFATPVDVAGLLEPTVKRSAAPAGGD